MELRQKYALSDAQRRRLESVCDGYRRLFESPDDCVPMLNVTVVGHGGLPDYTYARAYDDPYYMLEQALSNYQTHLLVEDDRVPAVRVEFGTAQFAHAFGCDLVMPTDAPPIASSHPLATLESVYELKMPGRDAGLFPRLEQFTEVYVKNLPEGMYVQHPDIQGPFNTAHLVRGNDILLDFYDDPQAVEFLLDTITDYMIDMVPYLKSQFPSPYEGWFFDWGAMWKGTARVSNCSTHLISPDMYRDYVFPRDKRFFEAIGGGRMHYCGTYPQVIQHFFDNPHICGLDFDHAHHSVWSLADTVPKDFVLYQDFDLHAEEGERIMRGELPKRNVVLGVYVDSIEEGREVYRRFKEVYTR